MPSRPEDVWAMFPDNNADFALSERTKLWLFSVYYIHK